MTVTAPESSRRKPKHQVGDKVETKGSIGGQGQEIEIYVKSIHTGEDGMIFYTVQTTFVIREGELYPVALFG